MIEWGKRRKGFSEVIVRAVISLYSRAKTKVEEGSELFQEFSLHVGIH